MLIILSQEYIVGTDDCTRRQISLIVVDLQENIKVPPRYFLDLNLYILHSFSSHNYRNLVISVYLYP